MRRFGWVIAGLGMVCVSCQPPAAVKRLAGTAPPRATSALIASFPAPKAPPPPTRLFLGVVVTTNSSSWSALVPSSSHAGALVLDLIPGAPAEKAGIKRGDVIVGVGGSELRNSDALTVVLRSSDQPDRQLQVAGPDGATRTVPATLVTPQNFSLPDYIQARYAGDSSPVSRFLVAQSASDPAQSMEILQGLVKDFPGFAPGQALIARRRLEQLDASTQTPSPITAKERNSLLSTVKRAIALDGGASDIRSIAARIYYALGDLKSAQREAGKAVDLDGTSGEANYVLGVTKLAQKGGAPQALPPLHRSVELNPFNPEYYVWLARCYVVLGEREQAKITIESAKTLIEDPAQRPQLDQILNGR